MNVINNRKEMIKEETFYLLQQYFKELKERERIAEE